MKNAFASIIHVSQVLFGFSLLYNSARAGDALTLESTCPNGRTVVLTWSASGPPAGGWLVEYSETGAEDDFLILIYAPGETRSFSHKDLEPQKTFHYRVRPFCAALSEVLSIKTGAEPAETAPGLSEGPFDETPSQDALRFSLRDTFKCNTAAPILFSARHSSPERRNCIDLRWQDRAADEDNFLVEMKAEHEPAYEVCAVLPPDTTSHRKTDLRPATLYSFRVLAIALGKSSNTARSTTILGPYAPDR